jgi:hypothetical protein
MRAIAISRTLAAIAMVWAALSVAPPALAQAATEHKDALAEPQKVPGAPTFVELPIFHIPVIEGSAVTRRVSLLLALELEKGQPDDALDQKKPLLIDAYFQDLYGMFAQRSHADRVAEQQSIRERLSLTTVRILGPGVVHQVLIEQLYEQPGPK